MSNFFKKKFFKISFVFFLVFIIPIISLAQTSIDLDGESLLPRVEVFTVSPVGDFFIGQTFDVPIYINTKGNNINTINLHLNFDQSKLAIVKPSFGKSIFGVWLEPPAYDNKRGTASFVGIIPNGIMTNSGLIATITFEALKQGVAKVDINNYSSANINDGLGSDVILDLNGSSFNIKPKIIIPSASSATSVISNEIISTKNNEVEKKFLINQQIPSNRFVVNYNQFLRIILILFFIYLILSIYRKMFSLLDKQKERELNRIKNDIDSKLEN